MQHSTQNENPFRRIAMRVSLVSIIGNVVLSLFKFFAGIFARSGAMVSDAVHSASDVFSSIIVIIGIRLSTKDSDGDHPYGHDRLECVAALVLAVVLLVSGLFIGHEALENITSKEANAIDTPGNLAWIAAVISIVTKEWMYWYTRYWAKQLNSGALMADAWHHRSDALSSVGALVGIVGARMGIPILDPLASLLITLMIIKAAYDIFKDAVEKMIDRACDQTTLDKMKLCVLNCEGVLDIDLIRTRVFGNKIYVDLEICSDGSRTLEEGHRIAETVHDSIESSFPTVKHIMVHVNPMKKDAPSEEEKNQPEKEQG